MLTEIQDAREWLPLPDVLRLLDVSRWWVSRRLRDGRIKGKYDHKNQLHISRESLNEALANLPEYGEG